MPTTIARRPLINGAYTPEWGDVVCVGELHWKVLKPDNGKVLRSNGVNADPSWETSTVSWGDITGDILDQTDLSDFVIAMAVAL